MCLMGSAPWERAARPIKGKGMTRTSGRASGAITIYGRVSGATFAASRQRGMTLIEILVVLVLIGIVLGIVGGNFIGKGEKAKADAAKIEISQIAQTLDLYKLET